MLAGEEGGRLMLTGEEGGRLMLTGGREKSEERGDKVRDGLSGTTHWAL